MCRNTVQNTCKKGAYMERVTIKRNENPTRLFYIYLFIDTMTTLNVLCDGLTVYHANTCKKGAYMEHQADKKKIRGEFMGVNFVLKGNNNATHKNPCNHEAPTTKTRLSRGAHTLASSHLTRNFPLHTAVKRRFKLEINATPLGFSLVF